jgi:hypothetical protein
MSITEVRCLYVEFDQSLPRSVHSFSFGLKCDRNSRFVVVVFFFDNVFREYIIINVITI